MGMSSFNTAYEIADNPLPVVAFISTPILKRYFTADKLPHSAASINGVVPVHHPVLRWHLFSLNIS